MCPLLTKYIKEVKKTIAKFNDEIYSAKPTFLFLRILKLNRWFVSPAAHGGDRTGRVFTGDSSDWHSRDLFKTGFANKPMSVTKNDGFGKRD